MRKFSSNPEVKALADLVWDYFSREEQYQIDRRINTGTPYDPWLNADKNALMAAENADDVNTLNLLLQKYRELDVKGSKKMANKLAQSGIAPYTPSALEAPAPDRMPSAPDKIDMYVKINIEEVQKAAHSALEWLDMIGEESTYMQRQHPNGAKSVSHAHMVVSFLQQALEAAEKLKGWSDQQQQVVPGESARLGSVKGKHNMTGKNADENRLAWVNAHCKFAQADFVNKPLADKGLNSYRYRGQYGWIMIGAKDHQDALREAQRSTEAPVKPENLQVWNGTEYVDVMPSSNPPEITHSV